MQIGEDDERQREREPAVQITTVAAIAQTEADDRDERQDREQAVGDDHGRRAAAVRRCVEVELEKACVEPDPAERDDDETGRRRERTPTAGCTAGSTNGATAMSAAPNRPAPIAAQASTGPARRPRGREPRRRRMSRDRSRGSRRRGGDPCRGPRRESGSP